MDLQLVSERRQDGFDLRVYDTGFSVCWYDLINGRLSEVAALALPLISPPLDGRSYEMV